MPLDYRLSVAFDVYRSWANLLASAQAAEAAGFGAIFRGDHILSVDGDHGQSVTEAWTSLAGLSRETTTLRLGTLVSPVTFRQPAILASMVATVNEMSAGRVEVGLGAGWYEPEHTPFGLPLPPWPERFDHLEEQLTIITGLLAGESPTFEGRHYRNAGAGLGRAQDDPHGTWPRPRILVGGNGKPRTLALAARFADEFNLDMIADLDQVQRALHGLDAELDRIGRPRDAVIRSNVVLLPVGDLDGMGREIAEQEAAGIERIYVRRTAAVPLSQVDAFARRFIGA